MFTAHVFRRSPVCVCFLFKQMYSLDLDSVDRQGQEMARNDNKKDIGLVSARGGPYLFGFEQNDSIFLLSRRFWVIFCMDHGCHGRSLVSSGPIWSHLAHLVHPKAMKM